MTSERGREERGEGDDVDGRQKGEGVRGEGNRKVLRGGERQEGREGGAEGNDGTESFIRSGVTRPSFATPLSPAQVTSPPHTHLHVVVRLLPLLQAHQRSQGGVRHLHLAPEGAGFQIRVYNP